MSTKPRIQQKNNKLGTRVLVSALLIVVAAIAITFATNYLKKPIAQDPAMPEGLTKAEVLWVSDGDTIVCKFIDDVPDEVAQYIDSVESNSQGEYYMRLIGYDAPESVHPDESKNTEEGRLASEFVKSKLQGKQVNLEFDTQIKDKYNRLLVYVWLEGALFNKTVLEEGHGELLNIPPNEKYEYVFEEAYTQKGKED